MNKLLIAVDSVGIDPLGHDRPESVYSGSRFLFPVGRRGETIPIEYDGSWDGWLVETEVVDPLSPGAIECAITYTSIFSGTSALRAHGLMRGLGLRDRLLEELIDSNNLFARFESPCLASALFPFHLPFLGSSYATDLLPTVEREAVEWRWRFDGRPLLFRGPERHGFAELFTLAEINQNIFVHAARKAGVPLRTWDDVRAGQALTSSLTHELESRFDWSPTELMQLPRRSIGEAAEVLSALVASHDFTFYKYQIPDLVSHTGRVDLARKVFESIEAFVEALFKRLDPRETMILVTSDHGHLEQVTESRGHPKSRVPTWCFGRESQERAHLCRRPEGIYKALLPTARNAAS